MLLTDTVTVDIVPAIIPKTKDDLVEKVRIASVFAPEIQIDFIDGVYASPASWPYNKKISLDEAFKDIELGNTRLELDLMIQNPEKHLDAFMALKPTRIVVHIESITNIEDIVAHSKENGYILGVAVQSSSPMEYIYSVDETNIGYFQLMGIQTIGSQGQPFDEGVLTRIRELLGCCAEHPVSIDGAVNKDTLPLLYKAGASRFVVGSAIWNSPDPKKMYEELRTVVIS